MADARFEDGDERPLRLIAEAPDDLPVIAALLQDAVLSSADLQFDRRRLQFSVLVNRFRWEDQARAAQAGRGFERVRSLLVVGGALGVASQGIRRGDGDQILSLMTLNWQPGADGAGRLEMLLAGDGAIRVDCECLDLRLADVTRPYLAPSRRAPGHPE